MAAGWKALAEISRLLEAESLLRNPLTPDWRRRDIATRLPALQRAAKAACDKFVEA